MTCFKEYDADYNNMILIRYLPLGPVGSPEVPTGHTHMGWPSGDALHKAPGPQGFGVQGLKGSGLQPSYGFPK